MNDKKNVFSVRCQDLNNESLELMVINGLGTLKYFWWSGDVVIRGNLCRSSRDMKCVCTNQPSRDTTNRRLTKANNKSTVTKGHGGVGGLSMRRIQKATPQFSAQLRE